MKKTLFLICGLFLLSFVLIILASMSAIKQPIQEIQPLPPYPSQVSPTPIPQAKLFIAPEALKLTGSNSASIEVLLDTGPHKVTGIQLEIGYDPKAVSDVQIYSGSLVSNPAILFNENNKNTGRISYAITVPLSQEPISGKGTVAVLTLRKNPNSTLALSTISILPKSLVSEVGVRGSVLKESKGITVYLSQ